MIKYAALYMFTGDGTTKCFTGKVSLIAVGGQTFIQLVFKGGGRSLINPTYVVSIEPITQEAWEKL